ncbi:hypothetical protein RBSWK_03018 [Rhodopirellula baltica SWK14]|uniref:Uncharacterized protein n=1 Tax=Rhodopirellula baltica SWK14 TaxID=993516 RepID=L7CHR5_RHOBT|nr:hypothetical protein RBSWK_03018 [Rhodopirellula baltica SWK14]
MLLTLSPGTRDRFAKIDAISEEIPGLVAVPISADSQAK